MTTARAGYSNGPKSAASNCVVTPAKSGPGAFRDRRRLCIGQDGPESSTAATYCSPGGSLNGVFERQNPKKEVEKEFMRVKSVQFEGAEIQIGSLTIKQVEDFFGDGKTKPVVEVVIASLNNAVVNGSPKWDEERIKGELDSLLVQYLKEQIMAFTGLQEIEVPKGKAAGEEPAASGS